MKTLKQIQAEAKNQGHCHCNLGLKCPCPAYDRKKVCLCYNKYRDNKKNKKICLK